jgi:hypothetical protein
MLTVRYFDITMGIVIESLLGWDAKAHRSRSVPGMFGFTKAFLAATEAQGSANLHAHILGLSVLF